MQQSAYEVLADRADVVVKETIEVQGSEADIEDETGEAPATNGAPVVEEVAVDETVVYQEQGPKILSTLLLGTPSPRSLILSAITVLFNLICVVMVADRVYSEHEHTAEDLSFVRLGYVSPFEARLLIREPDQTKMPVKVQIQMKNAHGVFDNPFWQDAGVVTSTSNETDYTTALSILLRSSNERVYEWRSSNNHSGEFTTPPRAGVTSEFNNGRFTFLTTSCIVSRLPYDPRDAPLAIPGLRHLAKVLPSLNAQFMLFLGDFIYIDVPRWWGKTKEDYTHKYRQVYASPDWPAVGQNLSWIHVLDDHEIANDWDMGTAGIYPNASAAFTSYHAAANPPLASSAAGAYAAVGAPHRLGATWYEFAQGPAAFFLLDSRTYRSKNSMPADAANKTMLGAEQLADLLAFLKRPEPRGVKWKVIASSVPLTKNWRVNTKDTWGGFLAERKTVLEAMWDASEKSGVGIIVLSGDRHEFAATKFPPPEGGRWRAESAVHEFSVSPLSQFYSPIPTYFQTDGEDVKLKYINTGNSKFGAITIESLPGGDASSLTYRLFVDGKEKWTTILMSPSTLPSYKGSFGESLFRFFGADQKLSD